MVTIESGVVLVLPSKMDAEAVATLQLLTTATVTASGADDEAAKACVPGTMETIKRIRPSDD
jgi:hypothetical protein